MTPLAILQVLLVLLFAGGAIALLLDAFALPGPNWPGIGAALALIAASAVMAESARICSMLPR